MKFSENRMKMTNQDIIIYFEHHHILITSKLVKPVNNKNVVLYHEGLNIQDIIHSIEYNLHNFIVIHPWTNVVIEKFKTQIPFIRAGGGIVSNPNNEVLFIYRRGKWDLPKGKHEDHETISECAIREVNEETGAREITAIDHLHNTYHIYNEDNRRIMKETVWFTMNAPMQELEPQTSEGIKKASWLKESEFKRVLVNTYPSVIELVNKYTQIQDN